MVGAAFALSCQIQARTPVRNHEGYRSAGAALLGESRLGLSGYFYEMADLYFHRGIEHEHEEAIHDTWFQARLAELKPHGHQHATGQASHEILAWLRLATAMNPHNVDFVLLAAFWMHHEAGQIELAQQILKDAQVANPFEYEIQLERGRLYLYQNNVEQARRRFDAALAFWPSQLAATDEDARLDRARPQPTEPTAAPTPPRIAKPAAPAKPIAPKPAPVTPTEPAVKPTPKPAVPEPVEPKPVAPVEWPALTLQGVIGKGLNGSAIINDQVLAVNETIEGVRVVAVEKQSVKLEYEAEERSLRVGMSTR
jgi:tetratricopeptide (TPR) repeat protein